MKRFTHRDEYGNSDIVGVEAIDLFGADIIGLNNLLNAVEMLCEYEDTGLTPADILDLQRDYRKLQLELALYKIGNSGESDIDINSIGLGEVSD